jgi:hypothetical protein
MLSRAVYGVQNERRRPGVNKLMLCTSRHDDEITCLDVLVFAGNGCFAFPRCEGKDLVDGMFLWEARISRTDWKWRLEQDVLNPTLPAAYRLDVPHRQSLRLLAQS